MKLPDHQNAAVGQRKLVEYLLSASHPYGRHKAAFFRSFGFSARRWKTLAHALIQHAAEHDVAETKDSSFGRRYIVDGELSAPDGRRPFVRVVWFIERGEDVPRFVTAYPWRKRGASRN